MKKFNFNKILGFFSKKKKKKENQGNYKLYKQKSKNKSLNKKRKYINLRINFKNKIGFIKKSYLPYFLLFFIIILFIIIGFLISPFFKIKYIEIEKEDNLVNMNIAYKAIEDIRGKSIFSIEKKDLLKRFQDYQENIASIDLNIKLPKTIKINIKSFKEIFNVYIGGKNYLLLENGSLVPKYNKNITRLNVVNNFGKDVFLDYKQVYNEKYIKKIIKILQKLKENLISLKIDTINFYAIERELHIKVNNFTTLIFSIDDDISIREQIKNLAIFNKDYKNLSKKDIIYIDLRIKDKTFFCTKENEYKCNLNLKNIYPPLDIIPDKTGTGKTESNKKIEK